MAVLTLGKLEAATLAQHAAAIVAKLDDSDWYVRHAAVETLGKLEVAGRLTYDHSARVKVASGGVGGLDA